MVVNIACMLLMFLLGRRLFDRTTGAVAAACYGMVSLSPAMLGLAAHATHFVVLFMLGGMLCLLPAMQSGRRAFFFASGLMFGLAFVMKQQGIFFGLFGGACVLWGGLKTWPINWRSLGEQTCIYCAGCVLPFVIVCLVIWRAGVFGSFWFWTFTYAHQYVGQISLSEGLGLLKDELGRLAVAHWPLMLLALAGGFLLWRKRPAQGKDWFLTVFFGISVLAVTPGFYFREHYFLLLLPAFSLLVGVAVSFLSNNLATAPKFPRWLPGLGLVAALVFAACLQGPLFFVLSPPSATRRIYGRNPFIESNEVADYIREHSSKDVQVTVFGSEPEIYFYAQRHSASGYIYMYDLVEVQPFAQQMQDRMVEEVKTARPEYLVLIKNYNSWQPEKDASTMILDWGAHYCQANYDVVGAVDMISPEETKYVWGDAAGTYQFQSSSWILVFHRKPAA